MNLRPRAPTDTAAGSAEASSRPVRYDVPALLQTIEFLTCSADQVEAGSG